MDTRTGRLYTHEEMKELLEKMPEAQRKTVESFFKQTAAEPTPRQMSRRPPKVGRNEPCLCGSGKKFKKCCLK